MLKPNAEGLREATRGTPDAAALKANGSQPHRRLEGTGNRHLHVALLGALAAAALIALAVPITRTRANDAATAPSVAIPSDGLTQAVSLQAQTLAGLAALPGGETTGEAEPAAAMRSLPGGLLVPESLLTAVGRVAARTALGTPSNPGMVNLPRVPVSYTLHEQGFAVRASSREATVGGAVTAAGIRLSSHDIVRPSADTPLVSGMHIFVTHAKPIRLIVGTRESIIYTRAETVSGLLAELGIEVQQSDRIFPGLSDPVKRGMSVSVVTFRDDIEFSEEPLVYETEIIYDSDLLQGDRQLVQAGVDGYVRRQYQVKQLDGEELDRLLVDETWVWPTNEVVAVGTRIRVTPTPAPTPAPVVSRPATSFDGLSCVSSLNVYATWYTAASAGGSGITATGTGVYKGIVAVDPRVIPLGTRMYIPGYGNAVAADTGGAIKGNIIDLGYGPGDVMDWRPRYLDICILG